MRRTAAFACVLIIMLMTSVRAETRLVAVSCGKADALLLTVDGETCLIDTAVPASRGRILAALRYYGIERLSSVVITHTDRDHTGGLVWLTESGIPVDTVYASAMFTGVRKKKHPAVLAAEAMDTDCVFLAAGDTFTQGESAVTVLAPGTLAGDEDNNSLVLRADTADGCLLLCGDMEYAEEAWLLSTDAALDCDVLKVANHADDDTGSEAFIRTASPRLAVISTSTAEKAETPDPALVERLEAVGATVEVTQTLTGWIEITLTDGVPSAERFELPAYPCALMMKRDAETVLLKNEGTETVPLADWYICSERGRSVCVFGADESILPGETIRVGKERFTAGKKTMTDDDTLTLYDPNGQRAADA